MDIFSRKIYIVVTDVVNDVTYSRKSVKCFVVFYVFSFPPTVYVGTLNLIASIPGPSILTLHVWSYDFYDMTLSTGKQQRHMINSFL